MVRVEPAVGGMAEAGEGTDFNHGIVHLGGVLPPV
jgi:hypothetical protein